MQIVRIVAHLLFQNLGQREQQTFKNKIDISGCADGYAVLQCHYDGDISGPYDGAKLKNRGVRTLEAVIRTGGSDYSPQA